MTLETATTHAPVARREVGLADTVGYADPLQVTQLFAQSRRIAGGRIALAGLPGTMVAA